MNKDDFLHTVKDACRDIVRDAVSGISVCTRYEDASLVGFMKTHQMIGMRLLLLPLAEQYEVAPVAEAVFESYMNQLEDIKNGSRCLLKVPSAIDQRTTRPAAAP